MKENTISLVNIIVDIILMIIGYGLAMSYVVPDLIAVSGILTMCWGIVDIFFTIF